ncbi:MAG: hypothetical protein BMS9Abin26_1140 [Gammaproteobacteria bacterium]|nr:MAG: hypothetical protein BMS9Abin26_1140 [Gammaproteobacteria bacterium]
MKPYSMHQRPKQRGAVLVVSMMFLLIMTIISLSSMTSSFMQEKMVGNAVSREIAFQAAEAALRAGERYLASGSNKDNTLNAICNKVVGDGDPCDRAYDSTGTKIKSVGDDLGDVCNNGFCTPREQDASYDKNASYSCGDANYVPERWQTCASGTAASGNNLNVFTTAGKYQVYPNTGQLQQVAQEPRFVIEFLGFRTPSGDISPCDTNSDGTNDTPASSAVWPFCTSDPAYFRVTAMGYGGTVNTRVMLQSTVVVN